MLCIYVQGPSPNTVVENLTDFFALELDEGKLKYYLNFGDQTQIGSILEVSFSLADPVPNYIHDNKLEHTFFKSAMVFDRLASVYGMAYL